MTLEEVILSGLREPLALESGSIPTLNQIRAAAKAVRVFLGSEEVVQRAAAAIKADVSARYKFEAQARAALSSIGGE